MVKEKQTVISNGKTFKELAEEWLEKKKIRLKQSSIDKYSNLLNNHILIRLGSLCTTDFCIVKFEKAIEEISISIVNGRQLSLSTMKTIVYIINSIIKYGVRHNYNADITFEFDYKKENSSKISVIAPDDQDKLMQHIIKNPSVNNLGILLSITTGMRIGEICALRHEDIDLTNKTLHICKTAQRVKTPNGTQLISSPPKTKNSNRYIPIPLIVLEYIDLLDFHSVINSQYYLLSNRISPYDPRTLQYSFKRLLKQCGINDINFHSLRHTFATNCIELGFEIKTLSEILGHSSVSFTLNRYVHCSITQKASQMQLIDLKYKSFSQNKEFCEINLYFSKRNER